jgi:hypothetical protein
MQEVTANAKERTTQKMSGKLTIEKRLPLHKKKFKYRGSEKPDWKKIDYPDLDKVNYFAHKQA